MSAAAPVTHRQRRRRAGGMVRVRRPTSRISLGPMVRMRDTAASQPSRRTACALIDPAPSS
ncbi:MAG: hypothetical protein M3P96_08885, partial [Actinomycetota bacterium]|nr:hypothetical protein [Actinomycetota bacterium]